VTISPRPIPNVSPKPEATGWATWFAAGLWGAAPRAGPLWKEDAPLAVSPSCGAAVAAALVVESALVSGCAAGAEAGGGRLRGAVVLIGGVLEGGVPALAGYPDHRPQITTVAYIYAVVKSGTWKSDYLQRAGPHRLCYATAREDLARRSPPSRRP